MHVDVLKNKNSLTLGIAPSSTSKCLPQTMDVLKLFKEKSAFCLKDLLHVDNFWVQVM